MIFVPPIGRVFVSSPFRTVALPLPQCSGRPDRHFVGRSDLNWVRCRPDEAGPRARGLSKIGPVLSASFPTWVPSASGGQHAGPIHLRGSHLPMPIEGRSPVRGVAADASVVAEATTLAPHARRCTGSLWYKRAVESEAAKCPSSGL